jgi:bifunctional UDP-N-acetylglucosamine pyrophosphorylase/glucosamine-1-phosphate N-acetyltransferase
MNTPIEKTSAPPRPVAVIILAAGLGTRMKSGTPKVLHEVCGRPMISYVVDAAFSLAPDRVVVVTGPDHDEVEPLLPVGCERAVQHDRLGSGDAVRVGMGPLHDFDGDVIVLVGDAPLINGPFLTSLLTTHRAAGAQATVATAVLDEPVHYGRIVRDADDRVVRIVEARDADERELAIAEVNTGFYVFAASLLRELLPRLQPANVQAELYLTDLIQLAFGGGLPVAAHVAPDQQVMLAINSRVELAQVSAVMRRRILERLMLAGVTVVDPASTYVDWGVEVGRDTVICPQSYLYGHTQVGAASEIGPGTYLKDVFVGDRARVISSYLTQCVISSGCSVGPFAYIRPNTVLREGAKAGTFVEIKNSTVGEGSKVPHLSYVGDTVIGRGTNIAAGNITANYDGFDKHPTTIGNDVKTGVDTTFVAPVSVGDGAFTAAGSVITQDVPADALAVARSRQENIEGYGRRRRERQRHEGGDA